MASGSGGSLPSFIARRLLISILLLFLISLAIFSLILLMPGDPAITLAGGTRATPAEIAKITNQLHLNQGFFTQYWRWLSGAVHGNLGQSLFQNESVRSGIAARFPVTFAVAAGGMLIAIVIGLPAGIISGVRQGTVRDRAVTIGSSIAVAMPDFWLGILLVIIFAVKLKWLPALGYTPFTQSPFEWFKDLLLPWLALGFGGAATVARQTRGSLIDTLDQDYMRTALAKGLSPARVVGKHALKNAISPVVTIVGIQFGYLLGGTFIIENIFSLPGIGTYMISAISTKDLPVVQGVALLTAVAFVVINLIVDVVYAYLNPKVRLA